MLSPLLFSLILFCWLTRCVCTIQSHKHQPKSCQFLFRQLKLHQLNLTKILYLIVLEKLSDQGTRLFPYDCLIIQLGCTKVRFPNLWFWQCRHFLRKGNKLRSRLARHSGSILNVEASCDKCSVFCFVTTNIIPPWNFFKIDVMRMW